MDRNFGTTMTSNLELHGIKCIKEINNIKGKKKCHKWGADPEDNYSELATQIYTLSAQINGGGGWWPQNIFFFIEDV